jgi:methylenetetrahydrofolate dehydrogenase (NADP+)/methenyltetrahydrofolate cyclohydrolase
MGAIVDGRGIRDAYLSVIEQGLDALPVRPGLSVVIVGEDPVIESFVRMKKKIADRLLVSWFERRLSAHASTEEVVEVIERDARDRAIAGLIVQLPLPRSIDSAAVLRAIPAHKDVDMLSPDAIASFARGESPILPPVVGAMQLICKQYKVPLEGREALVVGHGRLVGAPAAIWLRHEGAHVTVIDRQVADFRTLARSSAIIVLGAGQPGLLRPEDCEDGVVILDAGTSESEGVVRGDADPRCHEKSALLSPVPGGVGPLAVAMIFRNLVLLAREHGEATSS